MKQCFALLLAVAFPLAAAAQGYVGLAIGQSRTSNDLVNNLEGALSNADSVQTNFDRTDTAWKAFGGWRFNPYIAVEASYADLGKTHTDTTMLSTFSSVPAEVFVDRKVRGWGLDAVGSYPVGPRALVFARIGAFRARTQADIALEGDIAFRNLNPSVRGLSNSNNKTVTHYGVGGEWSFMSNLALRLEWERFAKMGKGFETGESDRTGEADADMYTVGVVYRFR